ncbi:FAD-binding protein, partial [Candidatus Bathyarchaeota archaeon]|nr:FAD-binding protein [Candidatus Bathyarchaeota archaeon]
MKVIKTDVLIIGAGAAGSMAAIKASDYSKDIIILEKAVHRSGGALGIGHYTSEINPICNVPGGPTSEEFVEGYLSSSSGWSGIENPLDKYIIAEEFTPIVRELESWGLEIYKKVDGSWDNYWHKNIGERMESGCWVKGGSMKKCLMDEIKRRKIKIVERTMAVDLLKNNNQIIGAVGLDTRTGDLTAYHAKSVVMCTGSASRTYIVNPGSKWFWMRDMGTNSGDGRGMAYRAGAELTMMELIRTDHMQGNVMARFWGGKCVNSKNEDFLTETYKKRWSRSYAMHVEEYEHRGPLYWNSQGMSKEDLVKWAKYTSNEKNAPDITLTETYTQKGLERGKGLYEFESQPIGFLGGPVFNYFGATSLPGLYAAGDEIWQDSLSGAFVFARRAGIAAAKYAQIQKDWKQLDEKQLKMIEETILEPKKRVEGILPQDLEEKVRSIMTKYAYLSKVGGMLKQGLVNLKEVEKTWVPKIRAETPHELMRWAEVRNILTVAEIHMAASLFREESVPYGRHFHHRVDYPTKKPEWYRQRVIVKNVNGAMQIFKRQTVE